MVKVTQMNTLKEDKQKKLKEEAHELIKDVVTSTMDLPAKGEINSHYIQASSVLSRAAYVMNMSMNVSSSVDQKVDSFNKHMFGVNTKILQDLSHLLLNYRIRVATRLAEKHVVYADTKGLRLFYDLLCIANEIVLQEVSKDLFPKEEFQSKTIWQELGEEICPKPFSETVMPFGKHKGMKVLHLPMDYLKWISNNESFSDVALKNKITLYLEAKKHADIKQGDALSASIKKFDKKMKLKVEGVKYENLGAHYKEKGYLSVPPGGEVVMQVLDEVKPRVRKITLGSVDK